MESGKFMEKELKNGFGLKAGIETAGYVSPPGN